MNLHQLRFVREAVRQNFNLTDAAKALFTSQPGVSKAIIELEDELGVDIFRRHGKRIRGLTEPGRMILNSIELIMQEIDDLKRIGKEYAAQDAGSLTIAASHTQARYFLPKIIPAFMQKYPKVRLSLLQRKVEDIAEMVLLDQANLAVVTASVPEIEGLVTLPCHQWEYHLVVKPDHPLNDSRMLTLDEIAKYPLITYDRVFHGRNRIESVFEQRNIKADILLEVIDADVIKTYVRTGAWRRYYCRNGIRRGAGQKSAVNTGWPFVRYRPFQYPYPEKRLSAQLHLCFHRNDFAQPESQAGRKGFGR